MTHRIWNSSALRRSFIEFFVSKHSHTHIPSSCVIPSGDNPGTYFVNSGICQFKACLLDHKVPPVLRAVNSQKCVRVGGKHNDLDVVGKDNVHHTFFEMLGNWSFDDYDLSKACEFAIEFLCDVLSIPRNFLKFTYFAGSNELKLPPDSETFTIWRYLGFPSNVIEASSDNFWEMGNEGPCGPCTEILFAPSDEYPPVELWNLVCIKYIKDANGYLRPLPNMSKVIDTGMGLERLLCILCSYSSNYDTDLFRPIIATIEEMCQRFEYENAGEEVKNAFRLLSDHIRMICIVLSDGLLPSKLGLGSVLRKVMERSVYTYYNVLHHERPLLCHLVPVVVNSLGMTFSELSRNAVKIETLLRNFEENFLHKIAKGSEAVVSIFRAVSPSLNTLGLDYSSIKVMCDKKAGFTVPSLLITDLCKRHGIAVPSEPEVSVSSAKGKVVIPETACLSCKIAEHLLLCNLGILKPINVKYNINYIHIRFAQLNMIDLKQILLINTKINELIKANVCVELNGNKFSAGRLHAIVITKAEADENGFKLIDAVFGESALKSLEITDEVEKLFGKLDMTDDTLQRFCICQKINQNLRSRLLPAWKTKIYHQKFFESRPSIHQVKKSLLTLLEFMCNNNEEIKCENDEALWYKMFNIDIPVSDDVLAKVLNDFSPNCTLIVHNTAAHYTLIYDTVKANVDEIMDKLYENEDMFPDNLKLYPHAPNVRGLLYLSE